MTVKPTAIFIGPSKARPIADAIASLKEDEWNFLEPLETIQQLQDGWEDGSVTNDIEIVLILSSLFDPEGTDASFETLIASIAPYCLVGIVNYHESRTEAMRARIDMTGAGLNTTELHYYMISKSDPEGSINKAVKQVIESTDDNISETARILRGEEAPTGSEDSVDPEIEDEDSSTELESFIAETRYVPGQEDSPNPYLGQVVSTTSGKGGSGKSSVAVALASGLVAFSREAVSAGFEERPLKVCLVDMDVRDGQLGFLIKKVSPTIINLHRDGLTDESIENNTLHHDGMGVDVILAAKRPRSANSVPPEFYRQLIAMLRRKYDYVILDTSVNYLDPLLSEVCYPASDKIILTTEPVVTSTLSMVRWITEVTNPTNRGGMNIPKSKIGIVVNKYIPSVALSSERIMKSAQGIPIISVIPSVPSTVVRAANQSTMEKLLESDALRDPIRWMVKSVVGDDYKLP